MAMDRYITFKLALLCVTSNLLVDVGATEERKISPELVKIDGGVFLHRLSGEFLKNGFPVDAPKVSIRFSRPLHIMKYQVSNSDYARCVADKVCGLPFKRKVLSRNDKPVTGVSFLDAQNYAAWLTRKTGANWRLPSDAEWAYSAGSRFADDALGEDADPNDPSRRALTKYRKATFRKDEADPIVKPRGAYGSNENGVYDQSGNVWEWTSTCYKRSRVSDAGEPLLSASGNCGVRVVEGKHRAYMTYFVQDAKSGGCAVGTPPDHLGFRLVQDNPPFFSIQRLRNWWISLANG